MSNHAYFFNSIEGDRKYDADSMTDWLKPFFKTGIFNGGCQVVSNNNMTVNVKVGYVNIDGKVKHFDEEETLVISAAHSTLNRIDNICVRRNDTDRDITLYVQEGTQSAVPVAPTPVRESGIYDLVIAQIYVNAAAVSITQSSITDTRMDSDLCGWVVSNVEEVDFEQIVQSWETFIAEFKERNQDEFDAWFEEMKDQLSEDAAGHLQLEIDDVNERVDDVIESLEPTMTIDVESSDGESCIGQVVTITNTDTEEVIYSFTYDGTPKQLSIDLGVNYKVSANSKEHYAKPLAHVGQVKYNTPINITLTYVRVKRFGFRRKKSESNPATRIEYLFDAVGKTPARMNFGTGFSYGDWSEFCNEVNRPVMLLNNGLVDYELSHTDHSKKIDGISASDYNNTSYGGNAMSEFRKYCYVYKEDDGTYETCVFADGQYDETYWRDDAFYDDNGNEQDVFYYGMFMGSNISSKLRSIAGQGIMVNQTATTEYNYAKANGAGWNIINKARWDYLLDLCTLISKSDDLQGSFGNGYCGASAQKTPGSLYNKGQFWGESNQTNSVKVFYVEDPYGNVWERMNGLINDNGRMKVKMHGPFPSPSDSAGVYSDYVDTGVNTPAEGYVKDCKYGPLGFIPKTTGGSASTYFCDYFYKNDSGVKFALVGGRWDSGLRCGRCVYLDLAASDTYSTIGSRVSY